MFSRIDHVALHVADIENSIEFYTTYFGFVVYSEHQLASGTKIVYLKLGDTVLELVSNGSRRNHDTHIALHAPNFNEAITFLDQQPLLACTPPHDSPARVPEEKGWRRATYLGPDNEVIEIRGC